MGRYCKWRFISFVCMLILGVAAKCGRAPLFKGEKTWVMRGGAVVVRSSISEEASYENAGLSRCEMARDVVCPFLTSCFSDRSPSIRIFLSEIRFFGYFVVFLGLGCYFFGFAGQGIGPVPANVTVNRVPFSFGRFGFRAGVCFEFLVPNFGGFIDEFVGHVF